uniref:Uncharacterized protein MANES_03G128200 n=1 Tax=Rhizophora mucronata TaxID=61149 RepID=A0A2P2LSM1_RHIMU
MIPAGCRVITLIFKCHVLLHVCLIVLLALIIVSFGSHVFAICSYL